MNTIENEVSDLLLAAKCALADLEGIMPEFEPSGDREHPGWQTIKDLRKVIATFQSKSPLRAIAKKAAKNEFGEVLENLMEYDGDGLVTDELLEKITRQHRRRIKSL